MAYTLGDKCARNLCKQTVLLHLIIENVVTCFLEHSVDVIFAHSFVFRCNTGRLRTTTARRLSAYSVVDSIATTTPSSYLMVAYISRMLCDCVCVV